MSAMTSEQDVERRYGGKTLAELKALFERAAPQNIDTAKEIEPGVYQCPLCEDGTVEGVTFTNYDGQAIGVQFFGIGDAHAHAEAFFRAATSAVPALIERIEELERSAPPAAGSEQDVERVARAIYEKSEHFWTWEKAAQYRFPDGRDGQDFYRDLARSALAALPASGEREKTLLTADEVMAEAETVASEQVKKVLRSAYAGEGRPEQKGKIAAVVLRDLALEPVTMFRRNVPREDAPIYARRRALASPAAEGDEK